MTFHGLTENERRELADAIGSIIAYFVDASHTARSERDAALARAASAETALARFKGEHPDGLVTATKVTA